MLLRPETSCPEEWRSWGCVESPGRRGQRQPPAEDYGAPQKMLRAVGNVVGAEDMGCALQDVMTAEHVDYC